MGGVWGRLEKINLEVFSVCFFKCLKQILFFCNHILVTVKGDILFWENMLLLFLFILIYWHTVDLQYCVNSPLGTQQGESVLYIHSFFFRLFPI